MVKETTVILMDTSDYMGYYESQRYLDQLDAMELYIELILKPHPEHYVGVARLGGYAPGGDPHPLIVEPTNDVSNIMTRVRRSRICVQGEIFLSISLNGVMNRYKDVKRMVVFIGGSLFDLDYTPGMFRLNKYSNNMPIAREWTYIGTKMKEMGVAVDVINFGIQQEGFKKHVFYLILAAANNNDNTRMLDRSGHHHLDASSFLALLGKGRTGLKSVLLMQGDDFQTAKNQFDKVHFDDLKPHGGNDNTPQDRKRKRENKVQDEGRERYADRYDRKHDDRGNIDTQDRKQKRDDKGHDEGKETTYRDRGDRYGRKRDNRGHDEGRESYGDRGDRHDRKRNYRGHDEGRESYDDRGGRYGRKRDYKDHDEGKDTGLGMVEYKRGRDESASSRSWIVKVIIS